jgi:hypothetical protein
LFSGMKQRASADAMDRVLHAERLNGAILRSMCSHRHQSSPYSDGATRHSGIRAQVKAVRSAGCWSQPGRGGPRQKTRWQT